MNEYVVTQKYSLSGYCGSSYVSQYEDYDTSKAGDTKYSMSKCPRHDKDDGVYEYILGRYDRMVCI